jgi:hypothetical protein
MVTYLTARNMNSFKLANKYYTALLIVQNLRILRLCGSELDRKPEAPTSLVDPGAGSYMSIPNGVFEN